MKPRLPSVEERKLMSQNLYLHTQTALRQGGPAVPLGK